MKRAKLSERTTPKLCASLSQRNTRRERRADEPDQAEAGDRHPLAGLPERLGQHGGAAREDDDDDRDDGGVVAHGRSSSVGSRSRSRSGQRALSALGAVATRPGDRQRRTRHRLAGSHPLDQPVDRRLHRLQEDARDDAHHDRHRDRRHHQRPLARRQVRQVAVLLVGHRPVVHALEHPQHVDRREDHAGRGERRPASDSSGTRRAGSGTRRRSRSCRAARSTTA